MEPQSALFAEWLDRSAIMSARRNGFSWQATRQRFQRLHASWSLYRRQRAATLSLRLPIAQTKSLSPRPSGIAVTWLHRNGVSPGSTNLLIDAVLAVHWPDHSDVFAWAACEARAARIIREHLRKTRNLAREQHLVVAYWNTLKRQITSRLFF